MPVIYSETSQQLYKQICAEPEDNTIRLIYADAIEEDGDIIRAQYIRDCISLQNPPDEPRFDDVAKWEQKQVYNKKLEIDNYKEWLGDYFCEECINRLYKEIKNDEELEMQPLVFDTGEVDTLYQRRERIISQSQIRQNFLIRKPICPKCFNTCDLFHTVRGTNLRINETSFVTVQQRKITFERGFPNSVSCWTMEIIDINDDATSEYYDIEKGMREWAYEIVKRTPITMFYLEDCKPFVRITTHRTKSIPHNAQWRCINNKDNTYAAQYGQPGWLPQWLFNLVRDEVLMMIDDNRIEYNNNLINAEDTILTLPSEQIAKDVLASALGRQIRRSVYG